MSNDGDIIVAAAPKGEVTEVKVEGKGSEVVVQSKAPPESKLADVSVRAWITLLLIGTVCYMQICHVEMNEFMKVMVAAVVGHYFGQQTKR